jgi:hypothetical protein
MLWSLIVGKAINNYWYLSVNFVEGPCFATHVTLQPHTELPYCVFVTLFFECLIFTLRTTKPFHSCVQSTLNLEKLLISKNITLPVINVVMEYFENTPQSPVPSIDFRGFIVVICNKPRKWNVCINETFSRKFHVEQSLHSTPSCVSDSRVVVVLINQI